MGGGPHGIWLQLVSLSTLLFAMYTKLESHRKRISKAENLAITVEVSDYPSSPLLCGRPTHFKVHEMFIMEVKFRPDLPWNTHTANGVMRV